MEERTNQLLTLLTEYFKAAPGFAKPAKNVYIKFFPSIGPLGHFFLKAKMSVCPSVCLLTIEVSYKRLFAPTSQSLMSKVFND